MNEHIEEIAIIGMSGAFPGAKNIDELWKLILEKRDGISTLTRDQLGEAGELPANIDNPSYIPRCGFLEEAELFDNEFFSMTGAEAIITDPQQRLMLTHSYLALADAGFTPGTLNMPVGVFAGEGLESYWFYIHSGPFSWSPDNFRVMLGNARDYLTTRISYKLNLRGPSVNVQTACSTSMTAVYYACQSLLTYGCDMALAGGVTVNVPRKKGYMYYDGMILSKTGYCKPFDEKADGTLFGEGVGVVCLKRLSEALSDGDYIYAVIKTVALNNDGSGKIGFTAPGISGQEEVINLAQVMADVHPEDIGFVETHGTATPVGDPIEISALTQSFRRNTLKKGYCYLGSIKANTGHLDAAAGIASLIKTALIVNTGKIPPMLNYDKPNPLLDLENSPFLINQDVVQWPLTNGRRIAGISSFGIGGTNVHAIIESPPVKENKTSLPPSAGIVRLSAKSPQSLKAIKSDIATYLEKHPELSEREVISKIMRPEHDYKFRWGTVFHDRDKLLSELKDPAKCIPASVNEKPVFLFPGQGSQFSAMAGAYYSLLPDFTAWVDRGIECAEGLGLKNVRSYLLEDGHDSEISETEITQPLLYIIEYALGMELICRGIEPQAVAGHSIGEYAAAVIADVMSFEDGLKLVINRGYWMQRAPRGGMVAVSLPVGQADRYLKNGIYISLYNTSNQVVLSGRIEDIESLEEELKTDSIRFTRLKTSHAFHTPLMEPVLDEYEKVLRTVRFNKPSIPFLTNIDGSWINDSVDWVNYWRNQLWQPVRFDRCINAIVTMGSKAVVEAGPGRVLTGFILTAEGDLPGTLPLLPGSRVDEKYFIKNLIKLWERGVTVRFTENTYFSASLILSPAYSFENKRFWPDVSSREAEDKAVLNIQNTNYNPVEENHDQAITTENQVLSIWKRILGYNEIKIHDNFFEAGGDSLTSVQFVQAVKSHFKIDYTVPMFLKNPTPGGIIDFLNERLKNNNIPKEKSLEKHIVMRDSSAPAYLAPQQERLWFLHELDPDGPFYNLVHVIRIEGEYSEACLEESLRRFFTRHEAFRTYIDDISGRPILAFADDVLIPVEVRNFLEDSVDEAEKKFNEFISFENSKPVDLKKYPSIKAAICRFSDTLCKVCLFIPHIFTDGWSSEIFTDEIREIYIRIAGSREGLTALDIQYSDYAAWENLQKENRAGSKELYGMWKEYLKDIPEVHELPLDFPRPREMTGMGGIVSFRLDDDTSAKIRKLCAENHITANIFFLSSFVLLLYKYSAQDTIMIGTPYANRELEELKNIFGYFIRTIPLRFTINASLNLREWFAYVREQFFSAWSMSGLGIDELVDIIEIPRVMNVNPIYQILFAYQSYAKGGDNESALKFSQEFPDRGVAENDLALYMWESDCFAGAIEYSRDLFEKSSIEVFINNYVKLVDAFLNCSEAAIDELVAPDKADIAFIKSMNSTEVPEYKGKTFLDMFGKARAKYGDKEAVVYNGRSLSYEELDKASHNVALRLIDTGVKTGGFIGVYLNRDLDLLSALIGVMKAGCAYVPLDPYFPDERLKLIIEDSDIELIISEYALSESELLGSTGVKILFIDEEKKSPVSHNLPVIRPEDYAYMLFTSGTTGRPKGVPITHGALANFLLSMKDNPGILPDDRVLALTTVSFDISGLEMYLPLVNGASVVMVSQSTAIEGKLLSGVIDKENITFIQATPTTWTLLFESGWSGRPELRLLTGGEALTQKIASSLIETGSQVWNMYGPTETTIWSSLARVTDDKREPLIGRPVANTAFYVLDGNNRILPPGIPGELAIAGAGLSTGYYKRPELTMERFIEIDLPDGKGRERVYKTGDLVQLCPSGDYRYIGRTDFQVKIRGFRIELGEIENTIRQYDGILDAVCVVWRRSENDKRIVAYYRCSSDINEEMLKTHLRNVLPEYMLPGHFMKMEIFPKTGSGKTDRKGFPLPDESMLQHKNDEVVLPRTVLEKKIFELWKEVLGRDGFGIRDNFFNLGGHSLIATMLIMKMNERFGRNWRLRDLFENPTIEMISVMHSDQERVRIPLLFPVQKGNNTKPLFLVAGIYSNRYYENSGVHEYERDFLRYFNNILTLIGQNRTVFGLRPRGIYKGEKFHDNVARMAAEYIIEIKKIQPDGPYLIAGECLGGNVAYEVAQQLLKNGDNVSCLILLDTYRMNGLFEFKYQLFDRLRIMKHNIIELIGFNNLNYDYNKKFMLRLRRFQKIFFPVTKSDKEYRRLELGSHEYASLLIRYRPERYIGKVLLIINEQWNSIHPQLLWDSHICPDMSIRIVPGGHNTRLNNQNQALRNALLEYIKD